MRAWAGLALLATLAASCSSYRDVFRDPESGFAVARGQRLKRGIGLTIFGVLPLDGDRGEPGALHPAIIEYVLGAAEGPMARYYTLVLAHRSPPGEARRDVEQPESDAATSAREGSGPAGVDYARALGRRLAAPINEALASGGRFGGSAGLYWGVDANLESGVLLAPDERDDFDRMRTTIYRFETAQMVVIHSSGLYSMIAWDVSNVPGAFDPRAQLDFETVARRAVALHPGASR